LASSAGVRGDLVTKPWSGLESNENTFTLGELRGNIAFAASRGRTVLLGLQLINTTAKEVPADLAATAFDAPAMRARFRALIDSLAPQIRSSVTYLSIGNEVDVYLAAHPDKLTAYEHFYDDAVAYVHTVAPAVKVGVTVTFDGANGAGREAMAALGSTSDVIIMTYYPLGANFSPRGPESVLTDLPRMVTLAGGKPLVLQEVGYPSADLLASSEAEQAQFITNVFTAWREQEQAIPFLSVFLMHDLTPAICDGLGTYYGLPDNAPFEAFLCSLGLRAANGTPKLAWQAFVRGGTALASR
jgi:hypothetical protein